MGNCCCVSITHHWLLHSLSCWHLIIIILLSILSVILLLTIVPSLGVGSRVLRPLCLDVARFFDGLDQKVEILISCSNNSASLNMKLLIKANFVNFRVS